MPKRVKKRSKVLDHTKTKEEREETVRGIRLELAVGMVRGEEDTFLSLDPTARMISSVVLENYVERGLVVKDMELPSKIPLDKLAMLQKIVYIVNLRGDRRYTDSVRVRSTPI